MRRTGTGVIAGLLFGALVCVQVSASAQVDAHAAAQRTAVLAWVEHRATSLRLGPSHPEMVTLRARVDSLTASLLALGPSDGAASRSAAVALETDRAAVDADLAAARTRYGEGHPSVVELVARRAALTEAIGILSTGVAFVPNLVPTDG